MNRSILIVICDFLLVSLLLFSTPDLSTVNRENGAAQTKVTLATNLPAASEDLAAAMRLALKEEQQNRNQLLGQLNQTRTALTEREKQAQLLQQQLQARNQATRQLQQQLQARDRTARQLQQQQARLEQEYAVARTNLEVLNRQLESRASESLLTKEQLAAMAAEASKRSDETKVLRQQLANLSQSNRMVLAEKQQLATRLQVVQVQKQAADEKAALLSEQVQTAREQNAKLNQGVQALATKSSQLAKEIKENRPLAPNTIFSEYVTNRVEANIDAARPGVFGNASRSKQAETVLVTDGTNIFALSHVQDTPLTLWTPGTDWNSLTGTLSRGGKQVGIKSLSFSWTDPRVVWMPVTAGEARELGCKVYRTSSDPFKFQDAVLVGTQEGYYGECRFEIDLSTPDYVKLDRSFLKGLFGKFNPSRGDLVFSRTGELLGIMANSTYCLMIHKFDPGATLVFGKDVSAQHTGPLLSQLYSQVSQMPFKLQ